MNRDMEEDINWGKLFLKVILVFVVILLVIWLISKFVLNNTSNGDETSKEFTENLNKMMTAAEKYYEDESKLPATGEKSAITLGEMIDKDLISKLKVEKTVCNNKSSYAKVTNDNEKYTLKVLLTCGSESDYKTKVIKDNSSSVTTDDTSNNNSSNNTNDTTSSADNTKENTTSDTSTNSASNNTETTTETVKEVVTDYTTMEYKFCKINSSTYMPVIYLDSSKVKSGSKITYSVKLNDLESATKISVIDKNYFISKTNYQDYKTNLDKNFSIVGADSAKEAIGEVNYFITGSLKSADFDYTISSVYSKDNSYYVDVEVNIKKNARTSVNYNNTKINYIPIRFTVSYANTSDCITDTFNNSYKYATYYVIVR